MAPLLKSSQPWVEKYRPKQVKDVAYQEEAVRALTNTLETTNCPYMLFYGPPGTRKTITALAICPSAFGCPVAGLKCTSPESRNCGINVVCTKIKDFAAVAVGSGQHQGGYPCPPCKIIILDEADSMTEDAQALLGKLLQNISYFELVSWAKLKLLDASGFCNITAWYWRVEMCTPDLFSASCHRAHHFGCNKITLITSLAVHLTKDENATIYATAL